MLKVEGVTISAQDGRLGVNGAPVDGDTLLQRLEFHAVKEIAIPADPPLAEMFDLLRALAEQPGDEDIASRLRRHGAKRLSVTMQTFVRETLPSRHRDETSSSAPESGDGDVPAIAREAMAESSGFSPATAATRTTRDLMAQLQEKPEGPHVGELLTDEATKGFLFHGSARTPGAADRNPASISRDSISTFEGIAPAARSHMRRTRSTGNSGPRRLLL